MAKKANKLKGDQGNNPPINPPFVVDDTGDNWSINGKHGDDLLTFQFGYSNIVSITQRGNGNGQQTILTDLSGDTYRVKSVETYLFNNGNSDIADDIYYNPALGTTMRIDATVDVSGQHPGVTPGTGNGKVLNGTGNDANNYVVVNNAAEGIELGLQVKLRGGAAYDPISVDNNGTVNFEVAAGAGAPATWGTPAKWSFDYSVITGLNGKTTDLGDFTFKLLVDIDVTAATNYRVFTMAPEAAVDLHPSNQTGFGWRDQDGELWIKDDRGDVDGHVAQNSRNFAFDEFNNYIDAYPNTAGQQFYAPDFGPGEFNIRLEAYVGSTLVAVNSVDVTVIA